MLTLVGIHPDEGLHADGGYGPYIQSERLDFYQPRLHALCEQGSAYFASVLLSVSNHSKRNKKSSSSLRAMMATVVISPSRNRRLESKVVRSTRSGSKSRRQKLSFLMISSVVVSSSILQRSTIKFSSSQMAPDVSWSDRAR